MLFADSTNISRMHVVFAWSEIVQVGQLHKLYKNF